MDKFQGYIFNFFTMVLACSLSLILLPFFRIPTGETVKFELRVKPKAIAIPDYYRVWGENVVGNQALFFSTNNPFEPYSLYLSKKEIKKLPENTISFKYALNQKKEMKTALVPIETKKCLFGGYLPAIISNVQVLNEEPEWSK
ncbi:hypothetical protein [Motilimonas sp. E26]|uniref:hypothetical protein n=1 Tax=Motilimonas sp. E26 TaxID=2865674 RepID=UPI001E65BF1D|nr:hypothetical protein [Motilimonas sp. E26]MCE0556867.1 hypothetical protein [Motilimonas sp. E26]